ncbi:hypothetical protein H1P_1780003 [Hyella patelloides LEGE 07179]|uniref:Uncharacterized protein n=1 Tax=Hyella patelloides LEGE 07179 TaxID=945734 RepID=A0A563VNH2_9CYAN|nr:hypothetical protein H1P_1780003 [Hyella patelloides LEGE 07179]
MKAESPRTRQPYIFHCLILPWLEIFTQPRMKRNEGFLN